jgi:diguanylate cyclase (GGDEF)-like protein
MAPVKIRTRRIGKCRLRFSSPERQVGVNDDVGKFVHIHVYREAASMAGVVGVWDWDIATDVLTWDPVMDSLSGPRIKEFQGTHKPWDQGVHPDDKAFVMQEMQAALRGWRPYQPRFRMIWPDGSVHHIQSRSRTTYCGDGLPVRMIGVNQDITEQVERELEVEHQRAQLAATMDALLDPLMFLTLDVSASPRPALRIAEMNPAACNFFGRNHAQLLGQPLSLVLPETSNNEMLWALDNTCRLRIPWIADEQPIQLRGIRKPIHADVRAVASSDGVVLSFRDVSERCHAAGLDQLTGLMNRKAIFERLARFSQNLRHSNGEVAVLFCDVDHFKAINDRHGHRGGDAVLSAFARRLLDNMRHDDLVGRIGGDELLVVLNSVPSLEAAVAFANKIHAAVCAPIALTTGEVVPTLSIGVCLIHKGESVDAVVERADQAMYQAKQYGRDQVISLF